MKCENGNNGLYKNGKLVLLSEGMMSLHRLHAQANKNDSFLKCLKIKKG